jgi:hypothetical protein
LLHDLKEFLEEFLYQVYFVMLFGQVIVMHIEYF